MCQFDKAFDTELSVSGSMSQHTVAMDACHPLCPMQKSWSMNRYVNINDSQQFLDQNKYSPVKKKKRKKLHRRSLNLFCFTGAKC